MIPLLAVTLIVTSTTQLDFPVVLEALYQMEAVKLNGSYAEGARGEMGPYQIKEVVWAKWSKEPFTLAAIDCMETQRVVKCQVQWLMEKYEDKHIRPTPELVGQAWNAGLDAVLNHRVSAQQRDYGVRFGRLYRFLLADATRKSPSPSVVSLSGTSP